MQFDRHFRILASDEFTNLDVTRFRRYPDGFRRLESALREAPAALDRRAGGQRRLHERTAAARRPRHHPYRLQRRLEVSRLRGRVAMEAWRTSRGDETAMRQMKGVCRGLVLQRGDLLALSDDSSLHEPVRHMEKAREPGGIKPALNPHAEQTLPPTGMVPTRARSAESLRQTVEEKHTLPAILVASRP